jgi:hypothetical protein
MTCVEIIVLFVFITDVEEEEEETSIFCCVWEVSRKMLRRSGGVGSFF